MEKVYSEKGFAEIAGSALFGKFREGIQTAMDTCHTIYVTLSDTQDNWRLSSAIGPLYLTVTDNGIDLEGDDILHLTIPEGKPCTFYSDMENMYWIEFGTVRCVFVGVPQGVPAD